MENNEENTIEIDVEQTVEIETKEKVKRFAIKVGKNVLWMCGGALIYGLINGGDCTCDLEDEDYNDAFRTTALNIRVEDSV